MSMQLFNFTLIDLLCSLILVIPSFIIAKILTQDRKLHGKEVLYANKNFRWPFHSEAHNCRESITLHMCYSVRMAASADKFIALRAGK